MGIAIANRKNRCDFGALSIEASQTPSPTNPEKGLFESENPHFSTGYHSEKGVLTPAQGRHVGKGSPYYSLKSAFPDLGVT